MCGSFEHLQRNCNKNRPQVWNHWKRVNHKNFSRKTNPHSNSNMIPRAVLMKNETTKSIVTAAPKWVPTTAKQNVNTAKQSQTVDKQNITTETKEVLKIPKVITDTVVGNHFYAVKASASWQWKPKTKVLHHVNCASMELKKYDSVDAQGRHK